MPRASKGTVRAAKASTGTSRKRPDKKEPLQALQLALDAANAERTRAVRDLETVRLQLAEQQRRSSQQQLVVTEALKDARQDRDRLLLQLSASRTGAANEAPVKGSAKPDPSERTHALEQELATAQADLIELRARVAAAEAARDAAEEALAKLRDEYARLRDENSAAKSAAAPARKEVEAPVPSVPPAAMSPASEPPASIPSTSEPPARGSFLSKLFGKRKQ